MKDIDKTAIHEDYQRGLTVRALAAKYGVPRSTINDWAKRYGWQKTSAVSPYVTIKELGQIAAKKPDRPSDADTSIESLSFHELMCSYAKKLLRKADDLLDLDDALAPRDLKSLSSMLLDVRTLLNAMSPLEEEEMRLKLQALRKQAEAEQPATAPVVIEFVNVEGADA